MGQVLHGSATTTAKVWPRVWTARGRHYAIEFPDPTYQVVDVTQDDMRLAAAYA
jgi:hypothetical protein